MVVLLALLACDSCKQVEELEVPAEQVDDLAVAGVAVDPAVGPAPLVVPVRTVNSLGVPVAPDGPVSLTVGGEAVEVDVDGTGYGELELTEVGAVNISGGLVDVTAYVTDAPLDLGLWPAMAPPGAALRAAHATDGALVASDTTVWWVDPTGAHVVLELPQVAGVRTAHVDADGILDAVVWGGSRVVLLKGRLGGGMTWGTSFVSSDRTSAGAATGDLRLDGYPDLFAAWAGGDVSQVQVLEGDGLWSFETTVVKDLLGDPQALSVGDNTAEGRLQVTTLPGDGTWERLVWSDEDELLTTGPMLADLNFPEGSELESGGDINGDGGDEIVVFQPPGETVRQVWLYDLYGTQPTYLRLETRDGRITYDDYDQDGEPNLWIVHNDLELVMLRQEDGSYRQRKVGSLAEHGPVISAEVLGGVDPDLLLAGPSAWTWWEGVLPEPDEDDANPWWELVEPVLTEVDVADPVALEPLADGGLAVVLDDHGDLSMERWDADGVLVGAPAELGEVAFLDAAVCGDVGWVLTDAGITRLSLDGGAAVGTTLELTGGSRVACGPGPMGSVAAVLAGTEVVLLSGSVTELGRVDSAGAVDLALADLGDGPGVHACTDDPCQVEVLDLAGAVAVVTADAAGVTSSTIDGDTLLTDLTLDHLDLADADGDGTLDLLGLRGFTVVVLRQQGGTLIAPELRHLGTQLHPPLATTPAGDGGAPLLWSCDGEGGLWLGPEGG